MDGSVLVCDDCQMDSTQAGISSGTVKDFGYERPCDTAPSKGRLHIKTSDQATMLLIRFVKA